MMACNVCSRLASIATCMVWFALALTQTCCASDPTYEVHTLIHANHSDGGALYFVERDYTGDKFYFSDPVAHVLRVGSIGKGLVDVAAGVPHSQGHADGPAKNALLSRPRGLCQAPDGSVLVLDTGNKAIRHVKNGMVTTVVQQQPSDCVDGPSDVASISAGAWDILCLDDGSMIYTDTECSKVRLVKCVRHCPVPTVGQGALMRALAEFAGPKTPEYIITTLVAGDHSQGGLFYQLARDNVSRPAGRYFYTSDFKAHVVRQLDTQQGTSSILFGVPHLAGYQNGIGHRTLLHGPRGLCQAPDGSVFVLDSGNQAVRRYKDGVVTTVVGNGSHVRGCVDGRPGEASISNGAWELICLPDGSMVYTDPECSTLRHLKCISNCPVHNHTRPSAWNWWEVAVGALVSLTVVAAGAYSSYHFNQRGLNAINATRAQHLTPAGSAPTLDDIEAPLLLSHAVAPAEEHHDPTDPFQAIPQTSTTTPDQGSLPPSVAQPGARSASRAADTSSSTDAALDQLAAHYENPPAPASVPGQPGAVQGSRSAESRRPSDPFEELVETAFNQNSS